MLGMMQTLQQCHWNVKCRSTGQGHWVTVCAETAWQVLMQVLALPVNKAPEKWALMVIVCTEKAEQVQSLCKV